MTQERFYVYVYLDQRKPGVWNFQNIQFEYQPFYVGKGTRKRDVVHLCPFMLRQKNHKNSTIKTIFRETGEQPLHLRIKENISQEEATETEKDFIKYFGRQDLNTGILCNHTDGGDGSHNLPLEIRQQINKDKRRPVYQYSLNGNFLKRWNSVSETGAALDLTSSNIATAISRGGTCAGSIWSYENLGTQIEKRIKYQMPRKFQDIKQVSLSNRKVVAIHKDVQSAVKSLRLTNPLARNKIGECIVGKLKSAYGYFWTLEENYIVPVSNVFKAVSQLTETGTIIANYVSIMEAARRTGIAKNSIWCCCKGRQNYAGGYKWEYTQ